MLPALTCCLIAFPYFFWQRREKKKKTFMCSLKCSFFHQLRLRYGTMAVVVKPYEIRNTRTMANRCQLYIVWTTLITDLPIQFILPRYIILPSDAYQAVSWDSKGNKKAVTISSTSKKMRGHICSHLRSPFKFLTFDLLLYRLKRVDVWSDPTPSTACGGHQIFTSHM